MKKMLIVDKKVKKRMAVLCFMPAVAFFITLVYYLWLLSPLMSGNPVPKSAMTINNEHFMPMFIMLAASATISAFVLLYCIVYMVKIKRINTGTKMIWMLVLLIVPISFILFWIFIVLKEPGKEPVYPEIG